MHNVDEVPGWSLNTDEGIAAAHSFLTDLLRLNETVQAVFLGLLSAWQDKNSMHIEVPGMPEHGKRYFEHINATYKPLVDEIFSKKRTIIRRRSIEDCAIHLHRAATPDFP